MTDTLQFDPQTGRVGRIQLIVRWVLVGDGEVYPRRLGIFSYETEEKAKQHAELLLLCAPESVPADLSYKAFWSFTENNFPAYPVSDDL